MKTLALSTCLLIACAPADRTAEKPSGMTPGNSSTPAPAGTPEGGTTPGEILSSRDAPVTLEEERTTVAIEVPAARPEAVSRAGDRLGLYVEGVQFGRPGVFFEVYANLPGQAAADPSGPHFVGTLSSFGPAGAETKAGFDITPLAKKLEDQGRWQGEMTLTFVRRGLEPAAGQPALEAVPDDAPPVRFRRIRIVRE